MPIALVNGARLNYVQLEAPQGPAEDLVMVHGLATNLAFWYLPYATAFAERYRVTVFDLRGHGRSQMTRRGYTPQAQAADLEGLLDALGIQRAHFVAHSFGGAVTLGLAQRAPDRVASLVLADTLLSFSRDVAGQTWEHGRTIQVLLDRHGIDLDARSPYFGYELLTTVAELQRAGQRLPDDLVALVGPSFGRNQRKTAKRWLELVTRAKNELRADDGLTPEILRSFDFPRLAIYGERSKTRATSELLRPLWPEARFVTLPDAGHFFPRSRSAELMAACHEFWDTPLATDKRARRRVAS